MKYGIHPTVIQLYRNLSVDLNVKTDLFSAKAKTRENFKYILYIHIHIQMQNIIYYISIYLYNLSNLYNLYNLY